MNKKKKNYSKQVERYIQGHLTEEETEELWAVILKEPSYYDRLLVGANLKTLEVDEEDVPMHFLQKLIYAGAAALVLIIGLVGFIWLDDGAQQPQIQPIASIELPFQRSADLTPEAAEDNEAVREAVLLYYDNNFEEAVNLLQGELNNAVEPERIAGLNITLGTLYYNEDSFEQAKNYFQTAASYKGQIEPLTLEKAYWYLGNTRIQLSEFEKAEAALRKVIAIDGAYSRVANTALEAMEED